MNFLGFSTPDSKNRRGICKTSIAGSIPAVASDLLTKNLGRTLSR